MSHDESGPGLCTAFDDLDLATRAEKTRQQLLQKETVTSAIAVLKVSVIVVVIVVAKIDVAVVVVVVGRSLSGPRLAL